MNVTWCAFYIDECSTTLEAIPGYFENCLITPDSSPFPTACKHISAAYADVDIDIL